MKSLCQYINESKPTNEADGVIKSIEFNKHSRSGNPQYRITFDCDGWEMEGVTEANAGWVYAITPASWEGKRAHFVYKVGRSGREYVFVDIKLTEK